MIIIPKCKYCGARLKRWGWYFDQDHPVYYWYRFCCDTWFDILMAENNAGQLTSYLVVLTIGAEEG